MEAYELNDKMKTLKSLTSTVQEREGIIKQLKMYNIVYCVATDRKQEIIKLQEIISSLNFQLTEKDEFITHLTSKGTDEEDSEKKSSNDKELPSKLQL